MSRLFGGILQAAGILIAGASGLCSLVFLGSIIDGNAQFGSELAQILMLVALFGGIPFVIGIAMFRWGRTIVRRAIDENNDQTP